MRGKRARPASATARAPSLKAISASVAESARLARRASLAATTDDESDARRSALSADDPINSATLGGSLGSASDSDADFPEIAVLDGSEEEEQEETDDDDDDVDTAAHAFGDEDDEAALYGSSDDDDVENDDALFDESESDRSSDAAREYPQLPEIDPIYNSETSDEEPENTVGDIPLEWYDEYPHIGYDRDGRRILKSTPMTHDEITAFLEKADNPEAWRMVYDKLQQRNVPLSREELEMIARIAKRQFPDAGYDPYAPADEWYTNQTEVMPMVAPPVPKSRFMPSKWEAKKIMKMVRAIRRGVSKKEVIEKPAVYNIWDEQVDEDGAKERPDHIPAPKMKLPNHAESYNPPEEYVFTEKELEEWQALDPSDRPTNFVPKKHASLRQVAAYERMFHERFERCLDLYMCPRMQRRRLNIDPESLIPKIPDPKDLEPFPSFLANTFKGHTDMVRAIAVDPTGQWMASASEDASVRVWDVYTGRCCALLRFDHAVASVAWNPSRSYHLLAIAVEERVLFYMPELGSDKTHLATRAIVQQGLIGNSNNTASADSSSKKLAPQVEWRKPTPAQAEQGYLLVMQFTKPVKQFDWHRRGDYFTTLVPQATSSSGIIAIHQLSKGQTQLPFRKNKGAVQKVMFHPSKPLLFVATQRYIKIYDLQKQTLAKRLVAGVKWISSMDIHPFTGDHVIIGSYDQRLCWFDLDLSLKPYRTLRFHKAAIRSVCYHRKYPLFASCADDRTIQVFHGMVYNDLEQNPAIYPVKMFKHAHEKKDHYGALFCEFHPQQPWLFSSGADGDIKLWC